METSRLRLKIKMELDFDQFLASQADVRFVEALSLTSGCRVTEISNFSFKRGCVIFIGDVEATSAKKIYELHKSLATFGADGIPPELSPLRDFVEEYSITEIKIEKITNVTIVRKHSEEEKNAVMFVHGWNGRKNSFGRLPEFIRGETGLVPLVYEYPTGIRGKLPELHFIAENLDNWVRNNTTSEKRRIAIVGHSMGGLVIRKMLAGQLFRNEPIHDRLNGVSFVASPYNGVWLASIAKRIFFLNDKQVKDLSPGSPLLVELNSRWQVWRRENPELARHVRSIYGVRDRVVAPAIAAVDDPEAIPILGAGHINIVKPEKRNAEIVQTLNRLLRECGL